MSSQKRAASDLSNAILWHRRTSRQRRAQMCRRYGYSLDDDSSEEFAPVSAVVSPDALATAVATPPADSVKDMSIGQIVKELSPSMDEARVMLLLDELIRRMKAGQTEVQEIAAGSGGCLGVVQAMERSPLHRVIQCKCLEAVWYLSPKACNKKAISEIGGIELIREAMAKFPEHSTLQGHACKVLNRLAASEEIASKIGENEIASIMNAIQSFQGDFTVQLYGCWLLSRLADSSEEQKQMIIDKNGFQTLGTTLQTYAKTGSDINNKAWAALENLK